MRTKINPKLPFNLPSSNDNEVFQIVSIGGFRRHQSKRYLWEVNVYFQRRYSKGKKSLHGDFISRWVNVIHSP
jgi:hypothetical protein